MRLTWCYRLWFLRVQSSGRPLRGRRREGRSAHGESGAQLLLRSGGPDGDRDDLLHDLLLLEAHRLLHGCARVAARGSAAGELQVPNPPLPGAPISSKGFMLILTLAVSTPVLSGLTRIFTA